MKILTAQQLRQADTNTVETRNITSFRLMQSAAAACAGVLSERFGPERSFIILSGTGNNGGDGLCIARLLHRSGYGVSVHILSTTSKASDDFLLARKTLEETSGISIFEGLPAAQHQPGTVVVDALFGTGIRGAVTGPGLEAILWINSGSGTVVSIDLPSGMPADPDTEGQPLTVVNAALTLTFQCPKLSMLLPGYGECCGETVILDIGLEKDFISHMPVRYELVTDDVVKKLFRPRKRFSHKGTYGHALLAAGSRGKIGAAILAGGACLRSGAGLLTLHLPGCGYTAAQTAIPEAMVSTDDNDNHITTLPPLEKFTAVGIGPGIGTASETAEVLKKILQYHNGGKRVATVLDADALNILSGQPELLQLLHPQSVLTPHPGEFRRLAGAWKSDGEMLDKAEKFAATNHCILVLKGHHTLITDGTVTFFNSTGNAGMAKGGSGDVLTGLVTGLAASGYSAWEAAVLGVYLHGQAGDRAAATFGAASMTSGDIIRCIRVMA